MVRGMSFGLKLLDKPEEGVVTKGPWTFSVAIATKSKGLM